MWDLITGLSSNLGYTIFVAYTISRSKILKRFVEGNSRGKRDALILGVIFGIFGIMGTALGIEYKGSIVNIRNIALILASITCGPLVGAIAGFIAGTHRMFYGTGISTAIACAIGTLIAGIFPGIMFKKADPKREHIYGILSVISIESISMIFITIITKDGISIVKDIFMPMLIMNCVGIYILISILNNICDEKEKVAEEQARKTLDIANETLPYFKEVNGESLKKVCEIIRHALHSEAVILTDINEILAYSLKYKNIDMFNKGILNDYMKKVIDTGNPVIINSKKHLENKCGDSFIIMPLIFDDKVTGTLSVSFSDDSYMTDKNMSLIKGLSSMISTQIQLGRIKKLEEMANKAEIRALQTQINPHFLFNALHTITSFVRIDPDKARELIVNLSDYLRFNIEIKDDLIPLKQEIEQVKAYVAIEKARFGDCIQMHYDINKEDMYIKIPTLTIEPLVENAIKHGILQNRTGSNIWIKCKKKINGNYKIIIEDDGCGIDSKTIDEIYEGKINTNKVGLFNVYSRIKLIYNKAPVIERLKTSGTRITFEIDGRDNNERSNS